VSWTYSGDPASSNTDAVRFLCGQTSTADSVLLADEELSYLIAQTPTVNYAAARACESLANQYATRLAEGEAVGPFSAEWGDRAQKLQQLAKALRTQAGFSVTPFVGGSRVADRDSRVDDTDRVADQFTVGMMDEPGSIQTETEST
jgi:hypothetical protein